MLNIKTLTKIASLSLVLSLTGLMAVSIFSPVKVEASSSMRITEIMFDPSGDGSKEFLEFYNGSNVTVSMSGWSTFGVDYVFPAISVSPGGYVVIARNLPALRASYPSANIVGQYGGKLKGSGELIRLLDSGGNIVSQVSYAYGGAWPSSPKNGGPSLSLIRNTANESSAACWAPSSAFGGSPSYGNSVQGGYGGGCGDVAYYSVSSGSSGSASGSGGTNGTGSASGQAGSAGSPTAQAKAKQQAEKQKQKAEAEKQQAEVKKAEQAKQEQQQKLAEEQSQASANTNNKRLWQVLGLSGLAILVAMAGYMGYQKYRGKQDVSTILGKQSKQPQKPKKSKQPKKLKAK